ncbi:hypothetical protein FGU46_03215 [Methanobacterium sp. CWC-01]|uniref:hypothetical protein n=1 Tax=Methanobacterium aridiramus TaxID=2584467 RepID=UPI00257898BA|nr:hypothetical protein [Methanobacterium sp. CWC-01]WJI09169.1 hypothetical protein FGU46_03215 [Methanobacterium sp. CWC-01]
MGAVTIKACQKKCNEVFKDVDLKKFRKKISTCPNCRRVVRTRTDHYHAEILCEECGAVIREQLTLDELPEICVTDRELEIEVNTYRRRRSNPTDKVRTGGLTRYPELMMKYDRSTDGDKRKWRRKTYRDFVGVVSTHFMMTRIQKSRVHEVIDYLDDIQELHRQASYQQIVTSLCILSMKRDKRIIYFDVKYLTKSQKNFIDDIGLTHDKYIRIMEKLSFPVLSTQKYKKPPLSLKHKKKT